MKNPVKIQLALIAFAAAALAIVVIWANSGVSKDLSRLERILKLLETDHERLWRQRANLNTVFEGSRVYTDARGFRLSEGGEKSDKADFHMAVFGASPSFGYAVEAGETYAKLTEAHLRKSGVNARVANMSQIGYSSWQGLKVFKKHLPELKPDLVTVSYMVNDIDRLRFFFTNGKSDEETQTPSAARLAVSNFMNRFAPTALFIGQFRRVLIKAMGTGDNAARYRLGRRRVPPEDYKENLFQFFQIAKKQNVPLIFILMPFRLPQPVPGQPDNFHLTLDEIEKRIDEGRHEDAMVMLEMAAETDQYASRLYYLMGRALSAAGRAEKAQDMYKKAVNYLVYDCARDAPRYNAIMASMAAAFDVPVVDAASALGSNQYEEELFVPNDYIHPNPAGHAMIAQCLIEAVHKVRAGEKGFFLQRCSGNDAD